MMDTRAAIEGEGMERLKYHHAPLTVFLYRSSLQIHPYYSFQMENTGTNGVYVTLALSSLNSQRNGYLFADSPTVSIPLSGRVFTIRLHRSRLTSNTVRYIQLLRQT